MDILLAVERQVRPVAKLETQQQQEAWQTSVEATGGKVPTGRIVNDVVQRIQVLKNYQISEVCQTLA
ncbi:hypothetical protein [Nostoc sp. PCC 7107]|uniref:hypothetical protein n=1 Tax=Nostoc sp. PCC 7107 TaxID=317936 RepID=UPI000693C937|nr:hypothetical protein [Nostoc sp. PCC 7107]